MPLGMLWRHGMCSRRLEQDLWYMMSSDQEVSWWDTHSADCSSWAGYGPNSRASTLNLQYQNLGCRVGLHVNDLSPWTGLLLLHIIPHASHWSEQGQSQGCFPVLMLLATLCSLRCLDHALATQLCPTPSIKSLVTINASVLLCSTPGRPTRPPSTKERWPTLLRPPLLPHHWSLLHLHHSPLPLTWPRPFRTSWNSLEMQVLILLPHLTPPHCHQSIPMVIGMQTQVPLLIWPPIVIGCAIIPQNADLHEIRIVQNHEK